MFLGGIKFKQFLSEHQEWHALVEGFGDGFCLRKGNYEPDAERLLDIQKEHHYYNAGRVIGFIALVGFAAAIIKAVF